MKNTKVTISDIAEVLGISAVSISRALSGQPGVSEELKVKIIETANEMGYIKSKKNAFAQKILVLHQKPYLQDNSNFSHMVQGIETALQNAGVDYSLEFLDKSAQEQRTLPYKLSKGATFDGVIFLGRFNPEYARWIREKIANIIYLTGYSPSYEFDSVWYNFNHAGYLQCDYLIKKGHRSIGFLGNRQLFRNKERLLGLTTALEAHSLPLYDQFFLDRNDAYLDKLGTLLAEENPPSAIICDYDYTALELIKALHEKKLRVPEDISVIGSGNTELSGLAIPALTTLDLNIDYACEVVVDLLLKRIARPEKPAESIAVLSRLIERDSVLERREEY